MISYTLFTTDCSVFYHQTRFWRITKISNQFGIYIFYANKRVMMCIWAGNRPTETVGTVRSRWRCAIGQIVRSRVRYSDWGRGCLSANHQWNQELAWGIPGHCDAWRSRGRKISCYFFPRNFESKDFIERRFFKINFRPRNEAWWVSQTWWPAAKRYALRSLLWV